MTDTANYIVVFDSQKVYYCNTPDEVKRTIKQGDLPERNIRIFEIGKEITLKNLYEKNGVFGKFYRRFN